MLSVLTVFLMLKDDLFEVAERTFTDAMLVEAHPLVADLVMGTEGQMQEELEARLGKKLMVRGKEDFHLTEYYLGPCYQQAAPTVKRG